MFRLNYAINEPVANHKTRKVLVIGNANVGKSLFLNQLINHPQTNIHSNTTSAFIKRYTINDIQIELQFINTADESRFGKMVAAAHPNPDYFIAVYDTADLESLNYVNTRITEVRRTSPNKKIILVGTKPDVNKMTCVTEDMIHAVTQVHDINSHYIVSNTAIPAKHTAEFISEKIARELLDSSALSDDYTPPEFVIACLNKKIDEMMEDNANTLNRTEKLRAARAVTSSAQMLLASEGVHQYKEHQSLQQTLKLVYKVITEPHSAQHVKALEINIKTLAEGHSVLWKKLTGALTAFVGVAIMALSAAGIPYTAGMSASGILGGFMVLAAGIMLFRTGMQKSIAKDADRLLQLKA
jgi:small GTP-binding protein